MSCSNDSRKNQLLNDLLDIKVVLHINIRAMYFVLLDFLVMTFLVLKKRLFQNQVHFLEADMKCYVKTLPSSNVWWFCILSNRNMILK